MKLIIFNLRHGTNLGDRLIAECLEKELLSLDGTIELRHADLAGRSRPDAGGSKRRAAFAILGALPRPLRRVVTQTALRRLARRHLRPLWRELLVGADAIILGGGQLLADQDLNFPIKVHAALDEAARLDIPVAIYAMGVAADWSRTAKRLFADALLRSKLVYASVRDRRSRDCWTQQLPRSVRTPELVLDPAMLTARHFPTQQEPTETSPIGLCVTSPLALAYHAGRGETPRAMGAWYVGLAAALIGQGHTLLVFTTGSPEDDAYVTTLAPRLAEAGVRQVARGLASASELAQLIAGCKLVVAHRLHACVPAAAYGIPYVGLAWDPKMESFFDFVGHPDRLISPARISAPAAVEIVSRVLRAGGEPSRALDYAAQARKDVATLFKVLNDEVLADHGV